MAETNPVDGPIQPSKAIDQDALDTPKQDVSDQSFNKAMAKPVGETTTSENASPMKTASDAQTSMQSGKVSPQEFANNIKQVMSQITSLQSALQTPNLKLSKRTKRLLRTKLNRSQENIHFISSKLGAQDSGEENESGHQALPPIDDKENDSDVVERFVGYLSDGQSQLRGAIHQASHMDGKSPKVELGQIMKMQVKLYRAQVEIEFSTAVIQKSIDDLKTVMSVQL